MDEDYDLNSVISKMNHFKDIKKGTISETYKHLNNLVRKSSKELENLKGFLSTDSSLPLFEERLCLMLIDSLRLKDEIVKILLSQNDYQISKVLGCKWFFQNLSSEFCTKELFPFISVSVRCKIINRLSKHLENTEEAQKYFEFIRKNYDNERANYLLPRCSPEFILSYFKEAQPTFDHNNEFRILFNICQRYPEVGVQILSTIFDIKKGSLYELSEYKKILLYLSGNHPNLILSFLQKHYSYMPSEIFGKKLTKKLGSKLRENLFPELAKSFLFKEKVLFSILNKEEQAKYVAVVVAANDENLTFSNWTNSSVRISALMKLVSAEDRQKIVESAFKEVYSSNFNFHSKCWTSDILELLPLTTREEYLEKLEGLLKADKKEMKENVDVNSFSPEFPEKFIYLYDSSRAFEKFKEILRKCPEADRRESVLSFMVKNCSVNNDYQKLQEIIEFIATRHRNDEFTVIQGFLDAITMNFPMKKLNSAIFEKLQELTYFMSLKRPKALYTHLSWRQNHIHYRLENNMDVDVKEFFQYMLKTSYSQNFSGGFIPDKTFVLSVCDEIMNWIQKELSEKLSSTSEALLHSLITSCRRFNQKHKDNKIYLRDIPGLMEIIKIKAEKQLGDVGAKDWPLDFWENLITCDTYGYTISSYHIPEYLFYIIKKNPELIEKHLEGILKSLLSLQFKRYTPFFNLLIMNVSFWEKTEKLKEIILNEFKNGDEIYKRKKALNLYSRICNIEEFTVVVESYLPKQEKVQQKNDGFDEIQILIPNLIKNVKPRWKNFELILKFFFGDFFKVVLPSFLACCYHTRTDFVIPFLMKQLDVISPKISYRKDIIKLIVQLSDREGKSEFFLKCWDEYKHYSIRNILMFFISKTFLERPSRESFKILEKCILECDEMTIKSRPIPRKIPKEFFSDYISALWRFSENQELNFKNNFRREMLWCFDRNNINLLPTEFCESIITGSLFNASFDMEVEGFTVLFLISEPESVRKRVLFVLDLIKIRKPTSESVFNFLNILIAKSQEKPSDFVEVFEIILENWPNYPPGVLFEEHILLTYYYLHYKVIKKMADPKIIPVEFGKELKTFFSNVDSLNELVFIYAETLKKFFKVFKTPNAVIAVKELVSDYPNRAIALLAVLSLPQETVIWHKREGDILNKNIIAGKKVLNKIFEAVESCNDKIVNIYMRSKFDFVKP